MTKHVTAAEFTARAAELLTQVAETGEPVVIVREDGKEVELANRTRDQASDERHRILRRLRETTVITGDILSPVCAPDDWELD